MINHDTRALRMADAVATSVTLAMLLLLGLVGVRPALARSTAEDVALTSEKRSAIVQRVAGAVEEHYVFEDLARKMGESLRRTLADGGYDSVATSDGLVSRLTKELQAISSDKHLKIYPYQEHPAWSDEKTAEQHGQLLLELARENFGFQAVEILPGNIGYVNIRQFYDPKDAASTAIAAMNFVANCDALIVDLRENGGGYTSTRNLVLSYLFDEPTHVSNVFSRSGLVRQEWTLPFVPGPKMADIPLYVLVSPQTFSAAEGFAFSLKSHGRATVIGETTAGGAHPVEYFHFSEERVTVRVPTAETQDPVTGGNWEGTGVGPDIGVPAFEQALIVANVEALEELLASAPEGNRRYSLEWALNDYRNKLDPVVLGERQLAEYAGDYGEDSIFHEGGRLFYVRQAKGPKELIPMGSDCFGIDDKRGYSKYRVQFTRNSSGEIEGFYIHDHDGDKYPAVTKNGA